ncbi:MAG: GNAT family N-acetyltransferase [Verrucomicrobiaceae bacterium]|nr:GNAT family N-acetyltransferase [Verrucomicrobiaceae bacterium]
MSVRLANISDSGDIFAWRNDKLTRRMSHSTDKVEWEDHSKWFEASLSNPNRLLLICSLANDGSKAGVVRFDTESDESVISINLAPSMRGKGFAKPCLEAALTYFRKEKPAIKRVKAEIKSLNEASRRLFVRVGFVFLEEMDSVECFEMLMNQP